MRAPVVCCVVVILIAPTIASAQDACGNVAALAKSLPGTTIVSSKAVPADDRLPVFCEVHATISPVAGSHIGAVYRLPMNWNGKVLGIGGGGFAGNLTLGAAAIGLSRGYAVIQNDMGHESTGALDPKFAIKASGQPNVEGIVDSVIARHTSLPTSANDSSRAITGARRSMRTGRDVPPADGRAWLRSSVIPVTTTV